MFIELVDSLRCVRDHEDSWLVLAAEQIVDRDVITGLLGCPVCQAEYPVVDGVADFDGGRARTPEVDVSSSPAQAMRCAALLSLDDSPGFAVLAGEWATHARELRALVSVHLLLVNASAAMSSGAGVSLLRTRSRLPLAAGSTRGIALDQTAAETLEMDSMVRSLRPRGRLLAPAATPVPDAMRELARDALHWVAEAPPPVSASRIKLERRRE